MDGRKNEVEWAVLWFITGFVSPYSLYIYTNNSYRPSSLLYISFFTLLVSLIASAKCGGPNIFKAIRQIKKEINKILKIAINDIQYWRKHGIRFKQYKD